MLTIYKFSVTWLQQINSLVSASSRSVHNLVRKAGTFELCFISQIQGQSTPRRNTQCLLCCWPVKLMSAARPSRILVWVSWVSCCFFFVVLLVIFFLVFWLNTIPTVWGVYRHILYRSTNRFSFRGKYFYIAWNIYPIYISLWKYFYILQ